VNRSALTGLIAILLGIIYSYQSYHLPRAAIGKAMAPIYFPLGLGILMVIFGIILFTQTWFKYGIKFHTESTEKKPGLSYTTKLIMFTSTISIIYALLFDVLGYVLSTILFLGTILFVVNGKKQWKVNMLVSISFALAIYLVFSNLLGIVLPKMPFVNF